MPASSSGHTFHDQQRRTCTSLHCPLGLALNDKLVAVLPHQQQSFRLSVAFAQHTLRLVKACAQQQHDSSSSLQLNWSPMPHQVRRNHTDSDNLMQDVCSLRKCNGELRSQVQTLQDAEMYHEFRLEDSAGRIRQLEHYVEYYEQVTSCRACSCLCRRIKQSRRTRSISHEVL